MSTIKQASKFLFVVLQLKTVAIRDVQRKISVLIQQSKCWEGDEKLETQSFDIGNVIFHSPPFKSTLSLLLYNEMHQN